MVELQATCLPVARDDRGDVNEQALLFASGELHGASLDGDEVAQGALGGGLGEAGAHDFAVLHHGVPIADGEGELQVLLHEQDRHAGGGIERRDRSLNLMDDRRLDALGGLVEQDQFRTRDERAGDGELLLLAARKEPGCTIEDGREAREQIQCLVDGAGSR